MKIMGAGVILSMIVLPHAVGAQQANSVYIEQVGEASSVTILQEGKRNLVGASASSRVVLGGDDGVVTLTQKGNDNVLSSAVEIRDSGNQLTMAQQGDRNSYSYGLVVGTKNVIGLNQLGSDNEALTGIRGGTNQLSIWQEGNLNRTSLVVSGSDNRVTSSSKGDSNRVDITSTGSRNIISATQVGASHVVLVNQTGSGASLSITQR